MLHTIASVWPSMVVTIGEPVPCWVAHQAVTIVGGAAGPRRTAVRSPVSAGQCAPVPLNTTYVAAEVRYAAAPVMISPLATVALAGAGRMPPSLARSTR